MRSLILIYAVGMAFGQDVTVHGDPPCKTDTCKFAHEVMTETSTFYQGYQDSDRWQGTMEASQEYPLVTNRWQDYLVDDFKAGTVIYVAPWPTLPIPKELRH